MKLLEFKKKTLVMENKSIEDIMTECEEYRETLVEIRQGTVSVKVYHI